MANPQNRGKSSHAAKHFCSIDQAAAMAEEAVKMARAERIAATAELVKAFEGRIAGLESRLEALESARWSVRLCRVWAWVTARIGGAFARVPVAVAYNGPILTEEAPTNG